MSRIYGANAIIELLQAAPRAVARVLVASEDDPATARVLELARANGVEIARAGADRQARSGSRGGSALGADLRPPPQLDPADLRAAPGRDLVVALDQVTDPHNLGAIVRSAGAFGACAVIVPKDRSAPLNDAAVRASAGAIAYVPIARVTNLARALRELGQQGFWSVAADAEATGTFWDLDLRAPTVLVMGAEGTGIRPAVRKACDLAAAFPLAGPVGSLNVSVAAGIALAEVARQRAAPA
ncbi:MAG: 23S rRNA (guanosine(2251)-2'-O)-methyltransferase RlmB [Deltaproteobacteria bacterium]|nr:23S rRNA (guanosine(2251)-2'-O)-methyltransferase RlmB [Deltaproteobacteria bacterium]